MYLRGGNESQEARFSFSSNCVSMHYTHVFESLMWGEMPSVANGLKCPQMLELFWMIEMSLHIWGAAFLHHGLRANRDSSSQVPAKTGSLLVNVWTFLEQCFSNRGSSSRVVANTVSSSEMFPHFWGAAFLQFHPKMFQHFWDGLCITSLQRIETQRFHGEAANGLIKQLFI